MEYYKTVPEWWHYPDKKRFDQTQSVTPKITDKVVENCHSLHKPLGPYQNTVIEVVHQNNDR